MSNSRLFQDKTFPDSTLSCVNFNDTVLFIPAQTGAISLMAYGADDSAEKETLHRQ